MRNTEQRRERGEGRDTTPSTSVRGRGKGIEITTLASGDHALQGMPHRVRYPRRSPIPSGPQGPGHCASHLESQPLGLHPCTADPATGNGTSHLGALTHKWRIAMSFRHGAPIGRGPRRERETRRWMASRVLWVRGKVKVWISGYFSGVLPRQGLRMERVK